MCVATFTGGLQPYIYVCQSWALSLFFQVCSLLNFYPWIAMALSLILPIFRFPHCSIALKKTSGSLLEKSAKMLDHSYNFSGSLFLKFLRRPLPPTPPGDKSFTQFKHAQLMKQTAKWKRRQSGAALRSF